MLCAPRFVRDALPMREPSLTNEYLALERRLTSETEAVHPLSRAKEAVAHAELEHHSIQRRTYRLEINGLHHPYQHDANART
jgi:hypothetical protein